jgi:hypothetical protein
MRNERRAIWVSSCVRGFQHPQQRFVANPTRLSSAPNGFQQHIRPESLLNVHTPRTVGRAPQTQEESRKRAAERRRTPTNAVRPWEDWGKRDDGDGQH